MSVRITRAAAAAAQVDVEDQLNCGSVLTASPDINNFPGSQSSKAKKGSKRGKRAQPDEILIDDIASVPLPDSSIVESPSSNTLNSSTSANRQAASGTKQPILISMDNNAKAEVRPGSPTADFSNSVLKPKGQAKQLIAREKTGMRTTSNKENMAPDSPAHRLPVAQTTSPTPAIAVYPPSQEAQATPGSPFASTTITGSTLPAIVVENDLQKESAARSVEQLGTSGTPSEVLKAITNTSAKPTNKRTSSVSKTMDNKRLSQMDPRSRASHFQSDKAPTRPTFELPGEAVAAKLKAAKEARLQRAALSASTNTRPAVAKASDTVEKRPVFKARPAPNMTSKPAVVRQTAASRARESLMHDASAGGLKRASSVRTSTTRPSAAANGAGAARRASVAAVGPSTARSHTAPQAPKARPQSVIVPSTSTAATSASLASSNRSSRPSLASSSITRTADGKPRTEKGKAVYARLAAGRDDAERKKREKEDAARRAREMAAEWGRKASQAWAEKKRAKGSGVQGTAAAGGVAAKVTA